MRLCRYLLPLLLLFPSAAFADFAELGYYFGNTGGTMTFNPTTDTLTLTSTITTIIGSGRFGEPIIEETGSDLGTITVTTGPLISGSLLHGGLFDGATITFTSNGGGNFIPFTFSGSLVAPLDWWVGNGFHLVAFGGGGLINGGPNGAPIYDFHQFGVLSGTNQFNIIQGGTTLPEPGTVVLVATGFGLLACRTKSRRRLRDLFGLGSST